jgi:thioredoxin reductase (NADPH)
MPSGHKFSSPGATIGPPGREPRAEALDCLVIGGGPAGLTAAIYLGRFRRQAMVVDKGWSRAEWIRLSHNLPGFPEGIEGPVLLERMRRQAHLYGVEQGKGEISTLERTGDVFTAEMEGFAIEARTVILATGVVENKPPLPHLADAVKRGLIRTCPICDGYESIDKTIAVLGDGEHAAAEALFIRTYTSRLTLILVGEDVRLSPATMAALSAAGIAVSHVGVRGVSLEQTDVAALYAEDGQVHRFDAIYTAFGTTSQSQLARALGARIDEGGRLFVDEHQQTSVDGLFAAGDLVRGLNPISVADGEAAIAATAVHNRLRKSDA